MTTTSPSFAREKPLTGIRVLDLSRILAGPYTGMLLADMGAQVLKVESPLDADAARSWGPPFLARDDLAPHFAAANRGKQLLNLDFKSEPDRQTLAELVARSDVVIENFKPGTLERLNLAPSAFMERHPRLIWCAITGYGSSGPFAHRAGYDGIAQAAAGLMGLTGDQGPMKTAAPIVDQTTGLFATLGILGALMRRTQQGLGGLVEANLFASALALAGPYNLAALAGDSPERQGNSNPFISPFGCFECAQGTHLMVTVGSDVQFQAFGQVLGLTTTNLQQFERHAQRKLLRSDLEALVSERLLTKEASEWEALLGEKGIACSKVNSVGQAHRHPQTEALAMLRDVQGIAQVATPVFLDGNAICADSAPPRRCDAITSDEALALFGAPLNAG